MAADFDFVLGGCEEDEEEVTHFLMSNFVSNFSYDPETAPNRGGETVCQALELDERNGELVNFIGGYVRSALSHTVTCLAREPDTGRLVGARLCETAAPGAYLNSLKRLGQTKFAYEKLNKMNRFIRIVAAKQNFDKIFSDYKATKLLVMDMMAVHKDYRRRAIATRMIQTSLDEGAKCGCSTAIVCATGTVAQRCYSKMGFDEVSQLAFSSITDDVSPTSKAQPLVQPKNGSLTVNYYVKRL